MLFNKLKQAIADAATQNGITEYEIYYMSDSNVSVETLNDEISSFSSGVSGGLCFRCLVNGKMGYASTELLEPEEAAGLVLRAVENAKSIEKEDTTGIFSGSPSYEKINAPAYVAVDASELKHTALEIQNALYKADSRVSEGTQASAVTGNIVVRLVNSHGLDLENNVGINIAYAVPVIRDGEESQESFEVSKLSPDFSPTDLAQKAVGTAIKKLGASEISSGKYNVVISGKPMRQILSVFSSAFSAKNAQLGLSLLAGKEGEKIASDIITITDDPMRMGNAMQTPFDAEGVATKRKNIIDKGVLLTLLHNLETAKASGVESTGNASKAGYASTVGISPYFFCIEAGSNTSDELLKLAENGVYITEVKGLHAGANAVTGDFSIESAGFLIENGKLTKPIKSFTIAGNFFELLKSIDSVSDTIDESVSSGFTSFGSPDIFIRNMPVAGK